MGQTFLYMGYDSRSGCMSVYGRGSFSLFRMGQCYPNLVVTSLQSSQDENRIYSHRNSLDFVTSKKVSASYRHPPC